MNMVIRLDETTVVLLVIFHILGFIAAFFALFQSRTPQGSLAWIIGLVTFPLISLPLFVLFGKRGASGYEEFKVETEYPVPKTELETCLNQNPQTSLEKFLAKSEHSFVQGNSIELLIDGKATYTEMLKSIHEAKEYILLQMYIFRTDAVGEKFAEALSEKARQGVKVYLLYDNHSVIMRISTLHRMKKAGVIFGGHSPGKRSKFYLNFRNHRKLLIVDGKVGYWGGVNIGMDYVGAYPDIGYWRDTNVRVTGPVVMVGQMEFAKDWNWSKRTKLDIKWQLPVMSGPSTVIVHNSTPLGTEAMNLLQHIELINGATKRIWIANPYIVPPQGIIDAMAIAVMKQVDVRIITPFRSDNKYVSWAAEIYYNRLMRAGVKIYRYKKGMMHQKVMLVDDAMVMVGSSNMDFRSMYINFENGILSNDQELIQKIEKMLLYDMGQSEMLPLSELENQGLYEKIRARIMNAFVPIM